MLALQRPCIAVINSHDFLGKGIGTWKSDPVTAYNVKQDMSPGGSFNEREFDLQKADT